MARYEPSEKAVSYARVREHLRDHARHAKRPEGTREVLDYLRRDDVRVELLDDLATLYRARSRGGPTQRIKVLDLVAPSEDGSQPEAEAFLWTYFAGGPKFPRGYDGPRVPEERSGSASGAEILNLAPFVDATVFAGADAVALRVDLANADPGSHLSPRARPSYGERAEELREEGEGGLPPLEPDDENPSLVALEEIERAEDKGALLVIRVLDGERDAREAIQSGPVEVVEAFLVQILGALQGLFDETKFAHGGFDLSLVSQETLAGDGGLTYDVPGGRVGFRAPREYPLFRILDLSGAIVSSGLMFGAWSLALRTPGARESLAWADDWRKGVGRPAQSHALDLHAIGLNVIAAIARRLKSRRESAAVRERLWEIARFCLRRLALGSRDVGEEPRWVRAFGKHYEIAAGSLWRVYRAGLAKALGGPPGEALHEIVFATYDVSESGALALAFKGSDGAVRMAAELATRAERGAPVLEDLIAFDRSASIEPKDPDRLEWWRSRYFAEEAEETQKKRKFRGE